MMKKLIGAWLGLLLVGVTVQAQGPVDTAGLAQLTLGNFLRNVVENNPLSANAQLLQRQAEAQILGARGAFDPKLFADWQQKAFDGKDYFTLGESGAKWQTLWGAEVKATYNIARGGFVDPMDQLSGNSQAALGVTVPLLNGLAFDANRAGLRLALLDRTGLDAQRRAELNDLLFRGGVAYLNWSIAYYQLRVTEQALQAALLRFRGIRESFLQGDKPGVDTLETYIQYQTRLLDVNDAQINLRNALLDLQALSWFNGTPSLGVSAWNWSPEPAVSAVALPAFPLDTFLQRLDLINPELQRLQVDLQQLQVDRRLALEQFKPRLDFSYNLLGGGFNNNRPEGSSMPPGIFQAPFDNYKWGLNFSYPLLLRKERGKLNQIQVKQQLTQNKLTQKRLDTEAKIRNYYNQLDNARRQVQLSNAIVDNTSSLLRAELRKFELGESSIFLINTREQKLFETQLKLIKTQGEYSKSLLGVYWATGRLPELF